MRKTKIEDVTLDDGEITSATPMRTSINGATAPSFGHALALHQALGHKVGCPTLGPSPTGPCICVLHKDSETHTWKWM